MKELMQNTRWFVYDYYTTSGRSKMEYAVFLYAREKFLHRLIDGEDLDTMVTVCNRHQAKFYDENKRLKPVEVSLIEVSRARNGSDGLRWLRIGQQGLMLRRVEGEVNWQD